VLICFVDRLDQVTETDNYAIVRGVQIPPH